MGTSGARVVAVSVGGRKGERKSPVPRATLVPDHGVERDAHAGPGHRKVSLLAAESIAKMREKGLSVGPGDFAENVTVEGQGHRSRRLRGAPRHQQPAAA